MKKIAIIWAGPAWIYTSLLLKEFDWEVSLFEENEEIWKKLKLTWGWRMNITNKIFWAEQFSSNQERVLNNFFKNPIVQNPDKIFDELWVEYFWQKNRAILKSENAIWEVKRLEGELKNQKNLKLQTWIKVEEIKVENWNFELFTNWKSQIFDYLIIASGWVFRVWKEEPKDKIYSLIKNLNHTVTKTTPSLSPLIIQNTPFKELAWTSFKWILKIGKKEVCDDILFTHKWLSWPAVLDFTSYLEWENFEISFISNDSFCHSGIFWKKMSGICVPNTLTTNDLEEKFQSKIQSLRDSKEKISTFLNNFLPKKLVNFILEKADISNDLKICELSKEKQKNLQKLIFHFSISWAKKMDYKFCWTTKWWVSLKEINVNSLESKIHKNLFFAGEILDINWLCWGYNISFWAICGKVISEKLMK